MEASLTGLCARAGLSSELVSQAAEYQRTLQAKRAVLGVSATTQSIVCLHLAASQGGHSVETKDMVRLAGAKSKPHYLGILQNAEKVLQLDKVCEDCTVMWTLAIITTLAGGVSPGGLCPAGRVSSRRDCRENPHLLRVSPQANSGRGEVRQPQPRAGCLPLCCGAGSF